MSIEISNCNDVAEEWEGWCGITPWSTLLRKFGELGGKIIYYCGYPQSKSAIPLCFVLVLPDGKEIKGSRLKDIREGIKQLSNNNP
ncbi:MAG TPA: hypothetical protein VGK47_06790 [Nitrososphaeraceae archaeon]